VQCKKEERKFKKEIACIRKGLAEAQREIAAWAIGRKTITLAIDSGHDSQPGLPVL